MSKEVNPHVELTVREKYLLVGSIYTKLGENASLLVAEREIDKWYDEKITAEIYNWYDKKNISETHKLLEILDRLKPVDGAELKQLEQAKPTRLDLKEPEIVLLVNVLRRQCQKNNILYAEVEGCSDFTLEENSKLLEIVNRLNSVGG